MTKVPILGVLGGTSLQNLPMVESKRLQRRITPFGKAGLEFTQGTLSNHSQLIFANRHGFGHRKNPSIINYRAIIWRMKQLGVTHLLSVSAVGSLREEIVPGDTLSSHGRHTTIQKACVSDPFSKMIWLCMWLWLIQFARPLLWHSKRLVSRAISHKGYR